MKHTLLAAATLVISAFAPAARAAETLVVPYSHSWQFMHPMGTNPVTVYAEFEREWWLPIQQFVPQYIENSGPEFGGSDAGDSQVLTSVNRGSGSGPFGYGAVGNWDDPDPSTGYLLVPLEDPSSPISSMGTPLTTPKNSYRRTCYFRTTFDITQPLINPVIRCMMDDGAVIFLDGVQVARVNVGTDQFNQGGLPTYTTLAKEEPVVHQTENTLYTINLNQAGVQPGSTGTLKAEVVNTVATLTPGIHTLAVCVVNISVSSADLLMALQLSADDGGLNPVATNIVRNTSNTPIDPLDDTFAFDVVVTQTSGAPGSWQSTNTVNTQHPAGTYGTTVHYSGFPVSGPASIHFHDTAAPSVTALLTVPPPPPLLWIGQVNLPGQSTPLLCTPATATQWSQVGSESALLSNVGGEPHLLESDPVSIPPSGASFSAILEIEDTSALGNFEANDSVEAFLVISNGGPAGQEFSLLPASLDRNGDHKLTGYGTGTNYNSNIYSDELNPAGLPSESSYNEGIVLSATIPPGTTSAQLVVRAVNNNPSESFRIKSARFTAAGTIPDLDRDGISDADELAAGTDPLSASSRFYATQTTSGGSISLAFPTVPHRVYRVLSSTNMVNWVPENTSAITGNGSVFTFNLSTAANRKYIRVQSGRGLNPWP